MKAVLAGKTLYTCFCGHLCHVHLPLSEWKPPLEALRRLGTERETDSEVKVHIYLSLGSNLIEPTIANRECDIAELSPHSSSLEPYCGSLQTESFGVCQVRIHGRGERMRNNHHQASSFCPCY